MAAVVAQVNKGKQRNVLSLPKAARKHLRSRPADIAGVELCEHLSKERKDGFDLNVDCVAGLPDLRKPFTDLVRAWEIR